MIAVRIALAALAMLWVSRGQAADPRVTLVLDGWGVFSAVFERDVPDPGSYSGYSAISGNVRLIERTHDICAKLGLHFGILYHLREGISPPVMSVAVDIDHPPMMNGSGTLQTRDEMIRLAGSASPNYAEWFFENPRELIAGDWHIIVRRGAMTDIDEIFHVHTACGAPIS